MTAVQATPPGAIFPRLLQGSDFALGAAVVGILVFMVIPLPPLALDLLLALSITLALVILLVSMYVQRPLEFSVFPSVLLLATLFRLTLNIATTRAILLNGNEGIAAAGNIIKSFGGFVVGGNTVVGLIVFAILVIINFAVITKGAGRIAEVAARFTLDAMPGKQMSIDADLNAGFISEQEARERRERLAREAEYYGAMDGANKFVRGDAVAGVLITLINIFGGLAIGVFQKGMSFGAAAQNYTILTVGDGLVSQIPALVISTAAGIVVSRAGNESSLGGEMAAQVLFHPRPVGMASAVLFGFALVPGLPTLPFLALSAVSGLLAWKLASARKAAQRTAQAEREAAAPSAAAESFVSPPPVDLLAVEVGYGLIPFVDARQNGELLERIKAIRRQLALELGIVLPPVHIQDNMQLNPGEYLILLKGNEVARAELMPQFCLALNPGGAEGDLEGVPTREPTYGLPATWIRESAREEAVSRGFTVVDAVTVLTTHFSETIRRHAHELLGRQEVQRMLDPLRQSHPKVLEELMPNLLSLGAVVKVLQNLLREQVPIRDLPQILEALADWASVTKDTDALTEHVRRALARTITRLHASAEGTISAITLGADVEQTLLEALQRGEAGRVLAIDPTTARRMMGSLGRQIERAAARNLQPVVLASAAVRLAFKRLVDRFMPNLTVLSYEEILNSVEIRSIGSVELSDAHEAI